MRSNETRERIKEYISNNAGASYSQIMEDLSLKNGTLSYHLYKLETNKKIKSVRVGMHKKYYPSGWQDVPKSIRERIYLAVLMNPGTTRKMVERLLELKRQVVSYHVRIMIKKGMLHLEDDQGKGRLYANPKFYEM